MTLAELKRFVEDKFTQYDHPERVDAEVCVHHGEDFDFVEILGIGSHDEINTVALHIEVRK